MRKPLRCGRATRALRLSASAASDRAGPRKLGGDTSNAPPLNCDVIPRLRRSPTNCVRRAGAVQPSMEARVTENNGEAPMRAFVRCALVLVSFAGILSGQALAQPVEEPEEIVVRAKPLNR